MDKRFLHSFPALTCLVATWIPEMSALFGKSIGEEARYRNKNVLLGPSKHISHSAKRTKFLSIWEKILPFFSNGGALSRKFRRMEWQLV